MSPLSRFLSHQLAPCISVSHLAPVAGGNEAAPSRRPLRGSTQTDGTAAGAGGSSADSR